MKHLIPKGKAEEASEKKKRPLGRTWYLPQYLVFNLNNLGKTRIVFDYTAVFKRFSLNIEMMQGPALTNDLLGVFICFRRGKVPLSRDIEAMFHQVVVYPNNRDAFRVMW